MPLPRSGAPSPGQPVQVGVIENVGRSIRVESACVSPPKTGDAHRRKNNSKRLNFIDMPTWPNVYSHRLAIIRSWIHPRLCVRSREQVETPKCPGYRDPAYPYKTNRPREPTSRRDRFSRAGTRRVPTLNSPGHCPLRPPAGDPRFPSAPSCMRGPARSFAPVNDRVDGNMNGNGCA